MKSEVVLLTKPYRKQDTLDWIKHYQSIGFDHLSVYLNDYNPEYTQNELKDIDFSTVSFYRIDGFPNQIALYNSHYKKSNYDWILFVDDDEFLQINEPINDFLNRKSTDVKMFGVYWQFVSYKDGEIPDDRTDSFSNTFKYTPVGEYKTIYKSFVRNGQNGRFINPHTFVNGENVIYTCEGLKLNPLTPQSLLDVSKHEIRLVHYWRKSKAEMIRKFDLAVPDCPNRTYGNHLGETEVNKYIERTPFNEHIEYTKLL